MRFASVVLPLALTLPLAAQDNDAEIIAAEAAWADSVVDKDLAALDQIFADRLIYAHSTGAIESKDEYLERLASGKQVYTEIDYDQTTVVLHGETAVAHSLVTMRGKNDAGPFDNDLMMIHTWVNEAGRWKLLAHQTTLLREN